MKKIKLLIIVAFMMILLSSCAADGPLTEDESIFGSLKYDFITMTYTNTSTSDILYRTGNPFDDFVILHESVLQESLTENEYILFNVLLDKLEVLSELQNDLMISIIGYSSQELKNAFDENQLVLTLDDIVSFNALKSKLDEIKTALDTNDSIIPKIDYIENRLDVELMSEEINNIDFLQNLFNEFHMINRSFNLYNNTYDTFYLELQNTGFSLLENEKSQVEIAYTYITLLIE